MSARKQPVIGKTKSWLFHTEPDADPMFCVWLPLTIVIGYFVLSAILRVISNDGSKFDQVICYGALLCFVIIMLVGVRDTYQDAKLRKAERKMWAQGCKTTQLTIVSRRDSYSWFDEYSGRDHYTRCSLELETNADQKAGEQKDATVYVEVNQFVYDCLKERSTVRIFYIPETPMTFLLEEEI